MYADHELVIKIQGRFRSRKLGIRFDMLCFFRMMEEFGLSLGDEMTALKDVNYEDMLNVAIFTGHESYCWQHKRPVKFNKKQIFAFIEDSKITRSHYKQIGQMWNDFMADFQGGGDKKKAKGNR